MTDERDPKVAAAYRALGAGEPPRALDDAILAAARKPPRSWTQRWAVPLSLAAVVVLSVAVTLHMQLEQPGIDGLQAPPAAETARVEAQPQALKLKVEDQLKLAAKPPAKVEARRAEPKAFADARPERARESVAAAVPSPAPAAPAAAPGGLASRGDAARNEDLRHGDSALRRDEERVSRDAEAAARAPQVGAALAKQRSATEPAARVAAAPPAAPAPAAAAGAAAPAPAAKPASEQVAKLAGETPEQEFERIAQLRREGRHDEADKAFLEFRRRYPSFKITEDMLRRVERR
jgi:hypothetical protein